MDRLTRKELKTDRFAVEVQHSVEFVTGHRRQMLQWGGSAVALLIVIFGVYFYRQHTRAVRQEALFSALQMQNASIGPPPNEYTVAFPTQADKDKALLKAFTDLATKYPGTDEGNIGEYLLGMQAADHGNLGEADKHFKRVADSGEKTISSLAKLALAEIYASEGKQPDGEKLLRYLMDHPTALVSKEQATFTLAHLLEKTNPQEARKLLEPLRSGTRAPVSRAAITALSNMSSQK